MEIEKDNNINSIFNKYNDKGLTGLANCGNSCYINSCLQVLSHTYEFNIFLSDENYKKKLNKISDSVLLLEWDKLRELMWSDNCTIAPWGFIKSVQKVATLKDRDIFTGYGQNDVQEFLLFLIEAFHNSMAREVDMEIKGDVINNTDKLAKSCYEMMKNMYKKEYSEMLNIFYGIHMSVISCKNTNENLSIRPEPFSVMSLPIPDIKNPSLIDCLNLYCKQEILEGENAWYNDVTKTTQGVKRGIIFWSLPKILIIDLKRWNFKGEKNNTNIDIPLSVINLSKYVYGYNKKSYKYQLYGVCNHYGGSSGGHYTAYVKNANNNWYSYNDTNVDLISDEKIISSRAYCLFFRKIK